MRTQREDSVYRPQAESSPGLPRPQTGQDQCHNTICGPSASSSSSRSSFLWELITNADSLDLLNQKLQGQSQQSVSTSLPWHVNACWRLNTTEFRNRLDGGGDSNNQGAIWEEKTQSFRLLGKVCCLRGSKQSCELLPRLAGSLQLRASKNPGPTVMQQKEVNSASIVRGWNRTLSCEWECNLVRP